MYFITENAAMLYTTATNTSLIVCACPLFAMLLIGLTFRQSEHFTKMQVAGSLMACAGMAAVVMNGRFVLHLSPIGDLLAFSACLCWAVYSLIMKPASMYYGTLLITRKVFFYGLLTIIPYYWFVPGFPSFEVIFSPEIIWSILFLGVVASMLCFLLWNWVLREVGVVHASNFIYLQSLVTMVVSAIVLAERITPMAIAGAAILILGMLRALK